MDFTDFTMIRLDVIFAIVGVVEALKTIIEKRQLSIYIITTLILSVVLGWALTESDSIREVVLNAVVYFGLSSFFYKAILRTMNKLATKLEKDGMRISGSRLED